MHTIRLRDLVTHDACTHGAIRYCDYLGITHIEGLDDLIALDDDVLDQPRMLVDYLYRSTLVDVIWAIRCLEDWREVAVEFARGCADAATAIDAARAHVSSAIANAAVVAGTADAATASDYAAYTSSLSVAAATAADAAAAVEAAADAAADATGVANAASIDAYEAERRRQMEHLRALLS